MTRRILVAYDGGAPAEAALEFALREFPDAAVTVLYVVEPFADHTAAGVEDDHRDDWRARAADLAAERFERAHAIAADADASIETVWEYGRPRQVIVEELEEGNYDQVVVGSHGPGPVERFVLGSDAETVVRRSPVPATVVRRPPE